MYTFGYGSRPYCKKCILLAAEADPIVKMHTFGCGNRSDCKKCILLAVEADPTVENAYFWLRKVGFQNYLDEMEISGREMGVTPPGAKKWPAS